MANTASLPASACVDYDKVLLFGDSITQASYDQSAGFAFGPALVHEYVRKLDVVNRGFSGYNTSHALRVLPSIIQPPTLSKIRLMTIFLGANDAAIEGTLQHVPLEEYRRNLKRIITHPRLTPHNPKIILIVPPPICEYKLQVRYGELGKPPMRTAEVTKKYADAAREVSKAIGVPAIDLWSVFMAYAGWHEGGGEPYPGSLSQPQNEKLGELLRDGLHFTPKGYEIMYDEVIKAIHQHHPELKSDALPNIFPLWESAPKFEGE